MPLVPGIRLGPYEILAPLGAGGMGEVYRARDARLGREVAIKVLPQHYVSSPQVRARFEREARTVSSLNHPHICVLYDIGREGDTDYLVMELVTGETVANRIAKGALSTAEVLNLGAQIAHALDSAHRAGVVHRDLKPGNVMLTRAGVKLMDFGLALEAPQAGDRPGGLSAATLTQSPAAGNPITAEGTLVGTLPYMAPEQLEGKEADSRSDLWALGCMLYEMASGTRAFDSKSNAGLIAAILKEEPRPLPELAPLSPPALAHVIERCLAKDPAARWQSAGDVARELEWISRSDSRVGAVAKEPTRRRQVLWRLFALAAGIVVLIGAVFLLLPTGPLQLNPDMRTRTVDLPLRDISYPGLSQDGRWIALPARDERGVSGLYYMNASGGEVRLIAVDSSGVVGYADISPDGGQVVYSVLKNPIASEVRLVSALGGPVRTLARSGVVPRWSPDGKRIGYVVNFWNSPTGQREFWTVRPDGSERTLVFAESTFGGSLSFAWSPDGTRIAWVRNFDRSSSSEIMIRDLATGRERQLTHDGKQIDEVVWTPQGEIVFSSNRAGAENLWIMRASGGPPTQITRGAGPDAGIRVSADGRTLLYLLQQPLESIGWWNVISGDNGRVIHEGQQYGMPCPPSPDGRSIVVPTRDPDPLTKTQALVILNRDGSGRRILVPSESGAIGFCWSPDGQQLAWFRAIAEGTASLHLVDVGTGETRASVTLHTRDTPRWLAWPRTDTLLIMDKHGSFQYSISTNQASTRTARQIFQLPPRGPGWIVMLDRRQGYSQGNLFLRFADGSPDRRLMPTSWIWGDFSGEDFLTCWPESLGPSRIDLPSGRITPLAHVPPEVRRSMMLYPTPDGRVIYWVDQRTDSKLVLVENFRK